MLEVNGLWKSFGGKAALEDVSFNVGRGEIFGLLGHNGAGKSTSLGIILGMVAADRGEVTVDGISVVKDRARALGKVGAIFESPAFYDYLSGWENLRLLMSYTCPFDARMARDVVQRVGLADRIHSKVRTYSHGMRQRLALAQSLLPEPEVLLLDEPTDGLDPEGIKWFRDFILGLRDERGTTVLFNSHLLAEVELMCDRVAILRKGRRVFEGSVDGLNEDTPVYEADLQPWGTAVGLIHGAGGEVLAEGRLSLPHEVDPADFVGTLVAAGVRVRAFAPVKRSLEDLYMEILNGGGR
ncbi:ABC transporter ATP-binding protein [Luteolibacter sp. SL250]|uniref:ABC transporter ATP-binding protein n=1 Tax=Luteolibacter sp. SL250 TaxID=2995170 RepID=UPI0022717B85|nr:ABC transporter ATP-binding protein [Luteolibacter sp. SL250]WAC20368.1 ABC transporter ATP-binding protein [Luteolibacter sp. SL250]